MSERNERNAHSASPIIYRFTEDEGNNLYYERVVMEKVNELQRKGELPGFDETDKWDEVSCVKMWRIAEETGVELGLWYPLSSFEKRAREKGHV